MPEADWEDVANSAESRCPPPSFGRYALGVLATFFYYTLLSELNRVRTRGIRLYLRQVSSGTCTCTWPAPVRRRLCLCFASRGHSCSCPCLCLCLSSRCTPFEDEQQLLRCVDVQQCRHQPPLSEARATKDEAPLRT